MGFGVQISAGLSLSPANASPTVFVIDADRLVRESLELVIHSVGWCPRTFGSAEEFLAQPRLSAPSCLVLDVSLPGLSGLELQGLLIERRDMPVIFVTRHFNVAITVQAMKAGAVEFLTKPCPKDTLLSAMRSALERSRTAIDQEAQLRMLRARYKTLSRREREVMALVVSGLLNKQVGERLRISEITVKAHRGQVMRKMWAKSLAQLVHIAAKLDPMQLPHIDLARSSNSLAVSSA
jgi:FixJ family two-component response regulator